MYKLDEVIGTEDAELVRKVVERKFANITHWTTRDFIVGLLDAWPIDAKPTDVRAWRRTPESGPDYRYVSLVCGNEPEVHVWSEGKGWL